MGPDTGIGAAAGALAAPGRGRAGDRIDASSMRSSLTEDKEEEVELDRDRFPPRDDFESPFGSAAGDGSGAGDCPTLEVANTAGDWLFAVPFNDAFPLRTRPFAGWKLLLRCFLLICS